MRSRSRTSVSTISVSALFSSHTNLHVCVPCTVDALNDAGVPDIRKGNPGAGKDVPHNAQSGEKATRVLGIKYKTIGESAKDTVEALRSRGW